MRNAHIGLPGPAILGGLAMLSACASSAPLRYYTLSEVPAATNAAAASAPAIRLGRVRIPGELDRAELVQRIDATRLQIAEQDRWAAALDDMIRRVLSADLQARGAVASSEAVASSTPAATVTPGTETARNSPLAAPAMLSLDIEEFIGDTTCGVTLRASWELKSAANNGAPVRSGRELIRTQPPGGMCTVAALPMAMSQALAQLSERILAAAR